MLLLENKQVSGMAGAKEVLAGTASATADVVDGEDMSLIRLWCQLDDLEHGAEDGVDQDDDVRRPKMKQRVRRPGSRHRRRIRGRRRQAASSTAPMMEDLQKPRRPDTWRRR